MSGINFIVWYFIFLFGLYALELYAMRGVPACTVHEVQQVYVEKRSFINKAWLIKRVKPALDSTHKAVNNCPAETFKCNYI